MNQFIAEPMADQMPPSGLYQVSRWDMTTQQYIPTEYINLSQQNAEEIARDLNNQ